MVPTRVLRRLRLVSRRALRPDVERSAGRSALALAVMRTSARLSHVMFAGLLLVAVTPSVRGAIDEVPQIHIRPVTITTEPVTSLAQHDHLPPTRHERRENAAALLKDAPAGAEAAALPPIEAQKTVDHSPVVSPVRRQAPRVVALAGAGDEAHALAVHTSLHASDLDELRSSKKFQKMGRLVAHKVALPRSPAIRAEPVPTIVLASLSGTLPVIEADAPPRRLLRVHQRGRDRKARTVAAAEKPKRVAALSEPPAPDSVRPIESVVKSAPYTVVATWSDAQIAAAKRVCREVLQSGNVVASDAEPMREGACGAAAPMRVSKIGAPAVDIHPGALLTCPMAAALDRWMTEVVQPAALRDFGVPVVRLLSMSSYSCRNRYGRANAPLSEHALINAVDLAGFVLRGGRTVKVLDGWGPVARDKHVKSEDKPAPVKVAEANTPASLPKGASMLGAQTVAKDGTGAGEAPAKGGDAGGKSDAVTAKDAKPVPTEKEIRAAFLHEVHGDACALFGTVLGPEANEAHRNHFHLDMRARRSKHGYCQ